MSYRAPQPFADDTTPFQGITRPVLAAMIPAGLDLIEKALLLDKASAREMALRDLVYGGNDVSHVVAVECLIARLAARS